MRKRLLSMLLAVVLLVPLCMGGASAAAVPSADSLAAAIVMDCQTGEIYFQKNIDEARPIASMTKLMTLYLVFEEIEAGRLSLDSDVTASSYAARMSSDPEYSGLERLREGASYKVDTLIRLIMTASCCGSVVVLAEHVAGTETAFVERMNAKAAEWGIDAHFVDCTGFENEGHAVSARAIAYIARRIILDYPKILEYSALEDTTFNGKTFQSTNDILRDGLVEGIDGLKTGSTSKAGKCIACTAIRDGRRIISVVMGAPDKNTRNTRSVALLEYGFVCRAARENVWAAAARSVHADFACEGGVMVYPGVRNRVNVTFSGVSGAADVKLSWELDGQKLDESEELTLKEGAAAAKGITLPDGVKDGVTVAAVLTFPDGTQVRREAALRTQALPTRFKDVRAGNFYTDAVVWSVDNGITDGVSKTRFAPDMDCTHAQILTFLWRAMGEPDAPAAPLKASKSYQKAIDWAYETNLIDGSFRPDDPCTRADAVTYLWNAFGSEEVSGEENFNDVADDADYAGAVSWAVVNHITDGTSRTKFSPNNVCSRGQIVTFLLRAFG